MFHICFLCQTECFGLRPWSVNLRPDLPLVDAQFATSALGIFSNGFLSYSCFIFVSSVGLHVSASARFATCPICHLPCAQFATSALGNFFQLYFFPIHVSYLFSLSDCMLWPPPDLPLAQFATCPSPNLPLLLLAIFSTVFLIYPRFIFVFSVRLHVSASARFATFTLPNFAEVKSQYFLELNGKQHNLCLEFCAKPNHAPAIE